MSSFYPVPASDLIAGIDWDSPVMSHVDRTISGDTYPTTWAADGQLYTSAGDPNYGSSFDGLDVSCFQGMPPEVVVEQINPMSAWTGSGGWGVKPTGMLALGKSLYLAVQNLCGWRTPVRGRACQHGSDATILRSDDGGRHWTPGRHAPPMFPGPRFGGPAFLQHGQDNRWARDEWIYAISAEQWDNGSALRVGRVPATGIQYAHQWTWYAGMGAEARPLWSPWLNDAESVLSDPGRLSLPEMVWIPQIDRYLLLTWFLGTDFSCACGSDLVVYESPDPWGPFRLAHHEREWLGRTISPYCPRIPAKWLDADGLGGWMLCSGAWEPTDIPAAQRPFYRPQYRRFRLRLR